MAPTRSLEPYLLHRSSQVLSVQIQCEPRQHRDRITAQLDLVKRGEVGRLSSAIVAPAEKASWPISCARAAWSSGALRSFNARRFRRARSLVNSSTAERELRAPWRGSPGRPVTRASGRSPCR